MSESTSRKRKQPTSSAPGPSSIKVRVGDGATVAGPAFASFPAIRPSKSTAFSLYHRPKSSDASTDFADQRTILAGETGDVEWFSVNKDQDKFDLESYNCQYVPALYDPTTSSLVLHPSTPTYMLSQRVKRLKAEGGAGMDSSIPYEQRLLMRNELGEAFGTRKAKSRIKAVERNKVDAAAHEGVKDHLMSGIEEAAKVMPSVDPAGDAAIPQNIPPPNMSTSDPNKVYPLDVLIPPEEMSAIHIVDAITKASTDKERMDLLPFGSSRWIEAKMRHAVSLKDRSERKRQIKIIYYISCMRQFAKRNRSLGDSEKLLEQMNHMPKVIIDGLIKRFTEIAKGSTKPVLTSKMEAKLLSYQFALCLACDNQTCEVDPLAKDLKMPGDKARDIFKSLGCTMDLVDAKTRERMGISVEEAKQKRRAVLQAPPEFPKPKRGGPPKR